MTARYQDFKTSQNGPHRKLIDTVRKFARTSFLRPIPASQAAAFDNIKNFTGSFNGRLILDSCCGTGQSTIKLAKQFPDHGIIGIDKSEARLARREPSDASNYLLVRGDVIDLWRLFLLEGMSFDRHYLFFPNPWPKIGQVKRRFYAHPVFKTMVMLAPYLELRTNWSIYAEECAIALQVLGQQPTLNLKTDQHFMTLFEKKYLETRCPIYIVTNELRYPDS